jgi:hypothetical protein
MTAPILFLLEGSGNEWIHVLMPASIDDKKLNLSKGKKIYIDWQGVLTQ